MQRATGGIGSSVDRAAVNLDAVDMDDPHDGLTTSRAQARNAFATARNIEHRTTEDAYVMAMPKSHRTSFGHPAPLVP